MLVLWEVMGKAMLDGGFLDGLLGGSYKTIRLNEKELYERLLGDGHRLSRLEREDLTMWLKDELFVGMMRELVDAWTTGRIAKNYPNDLENPSEFHAAAALSLLDDQFRQFFQTQNKNPDQLRDQFQFELTQQEIEWIARFLEIPKVVTSFLAIKRLYWDSSCYEAMTPILGGTAPRSSPASSIPQPGPRGYH
jgi:hypothetical protein